MFIHVFIYSFSHLFILRWIHEYLFYTLGYKLILCYLFCWTDCSSLGIGSCFNFILFPLAFPCYCEFSKCFLTSMHWKMFQIQSVYFLPKSRFIHFSKEVFWLENCFRNPELVSRYAHCYWESLFLGPVSW